MPGVAPPVSTGASKKECIYFKRDEEIKTPAPRRASSRESIECHAETVDPYGLPSPDYVEADSPAELYSAKLSNYIQMTIEMICGREFEMHFYATERLVAQIHDVVLKDVLGDRSNMFMAMVIAEESEHIPTMIWKWFQDHNARLIKKITTVLDQIPAVREAKQQNCFAQQAILWDYQMLCKITVACDLGFIDFDRAVMYVRGCMILYLRQP